MNVCTFDGGRCTVCGAPKINARQACGVFAGVSPPAGPGTELKKILSRVGITSAPDCSCNAHAAEMDRNGCEWVEANMSTVVGWLREQAAARGLPFLDAAGRALVLVAVRNARRAATPAGGSVDQPRA